MWAAGQLVPVLFFQPHALKYHVRVHWVSVRGSVLS
jgi:hypothetical protein